MWFSWCYQREKDKSMWLVDVGVVYRSRQRGDMCCFLFTDVLFFCLRRGAKWCNMEM
jgi:hypothetical protein